MELSFIRALKFVVSLFIIILVMYFITPIFARLIGVEFGILEYVIVGFMSGIIFLYAYVTGGEVNIMNVVKSIVAFYVTLFLFGIIFTLHGQDTGNSVLESIKTFFRYVVPYIALVAGLMHSIEYYVEEQEVTGEVIKIG